MTKHANALFVRFIVLSIAIHVGVCHAKADDTVSRPNVVLILADDLGCVDLGCTGSDLHQTPVIDALAAESMWFGRAYAAPTCSPSRSAILSGKNPAKLGIVGHGGIRKMGGGGDFLVGTEYTLAEALRDGGYSTCHIGKWHVGQAKANRPEQQGFATVVAANEFCCPGSFFYPFRDRRKGSKNAKLSAVPDLESYGPSDHLTPSLGSEADSFIQQAAQGDQPFFLNLWYYAVHTPIEAMPEKVDKHSALKKPGAKHRNPEYAGLVEHLDDSVRIVLQALEDSGVADNTIVIFYSDNGGEVRRGITSNAPMRSGKTTLYEGGVRVPLFVRWPGVTRPGTTSEERVVGQDLYPTILAMTGVAGQQEQNREMDGVDFSALLRDPSATLPPRSLHWLRYGELVHYPTYKTDRTFGPSAAIIGKEGWKLIEHYPTPHGLERRYELFDLEQDPYEQHDLAKSRRDKVAELKHELTEWQREIDTPSYEELAYPAFEKINGAGDSRAGERLRP